MPGGSGLELLEWVSNDIKLVTIFCTSYADNYAKKAIELQCFDYFLKPIAYDELSNRIKKAYDEAARIIHSQNDEKLTFLEQEAKSINYWNNLLLPHVQSPHEPHPDTFIGYSTYDRFLLCSINTFDTSGEIPSWKLYGCKNITYELLEGSGILSIETSFLVQNSLALIIIKHRHQILR